MGRGYSFEDEVIKLLNQTKYSEIRDSFWRSFLKEVFPNIKMEDVIYVQKLGGVYKADILLFLNRKSKPVGISLKSGSGNSVHQEPLNTFISFCKKILQAPADICHYIEWFIMERKSAKKLYAEYPERFNALNKFFHENRIPLLKRFLITGTANKGFAEFIIHKDDANITFSKTEAIIKECMKENSVIFRQKRNTISVGPLTFQAWNRNVSGDPNRPSEKKRGHIQLKWGKIHEDLQKIRQHLQEAE
jgi:hypothetical protein